MTKTFQTATLTWSRFLISLVPILIGMYVGTNAMPDDWLGLLIGGTLGLIIQFGAPVFLSLLKKPEGAFFKTMVIAIVASYVLSYAAMGLGFLLGQPTAENAAAQHFVSLDLWGRVTFFSRLAVSLVGEELITACFLFPVLWWALKHYQVKTAWWLAMVVSSLAFGMMHYNAYDWNLYQMLITVGLTRIPFDWAWYKTNSLWTGVVGHIIFDLLAFLVGAMAG